MAKRGRKRKFKLSFDINPETLRSIVAVALLLFSILALISFIFPNYLVNAKLQLVLRKSLGYSSLFFPFIAAISGLLFIDALKTRIKDMRIVLGLAMLMVAIAGFFHLFIPGGEAQQAALDGRGGGFIGYIVAVTLRDLISTAGALFVLLALVAVSVILILNISIDDVIELFNKVFKGGKLFNFINKKEDLIEMQAGMTGLDQDEEAFGQAGIPFAVRDAAKAKDSKIEPKFEIIPTVSEPQIGAEITSVAPGKERVPKGPGGLPYPDVVWRLPDPSLLDENTGGPPDIGDVEANKKIITDTLGSFGITGVRVVDVQVGPTVTKYALDTPPGIRMANIQTLQNDLARALASITGQVRIEAPIPGKALIGVELPNRRRAIVDFKSLITSEQMKASKSKLAIVLGTDVGGLTHIYDIGKMPHLLVAGQTGSGKSVFLHNIILSILFRATPEEVKLILVDPKRVELKVFEDIPHLYAPPIVEKEQATAVFSWAVKEMKKRYKMFESARVASIQQYNEKSGFQALPYIVIIVDEFTEIIMADPRSLEKHVVSIAQLARATGIHLILAAQRPEADVITGLIKANIPCRAAFAVAGMQDSRIIIDGPGAEKLLGDGDMLFIPPDKRIPIRLQAALITHRERENVVEFLKSQGGPPEYREDIFTTPTDEEKDRSVAAGGENRDRLYDEAAQTIIAAGKGSASLLQRRLSVGYARAARIIDELEKGGIVGPAQGSRARDVLSDTLPLDKKEMYETHEEEAEPEEPNDEEY